MSWQFTPYTAPLIITGAIMLFLTLYAWRRQHWLALRVRGRLEEQVRELTAELSRVNKRFGEEVERRKRIEEESRLSEERYRRILDTCHDMIAVFDENATVLYSNKALHEVTGFETDKEFVDGFGFPNVHPDDREGVIEWFFRVLNGEPARCKEYRGINKMGEVQWVEANADLIYWPGAGRAVLDVLRDVTPRKKVEQALKESEKRYRTLVEQAKDIIYTIDLETQTISSANSFAEEILGYSRETVVGKRHFSELVHLDDAAMLAAQLKRLIEGGKRIPNFPFRMKKADGTHLDVEQNGAIISDSDGKPATYMGVARDVTERKRMEEALRQSEQRYNRILDSSYDMIFVVEVNGKVLYANMAYLEHMGYAIGDVNKIGVLNTIHLDDRGRITGEVEKVISGHPVRNIEYRVVRKDGEIRWMESNIDPIQWPGVENVVVNVARDVTERRKMEFQLQQASKLAAIGELAAGVAHEINNPIAAVDVRTGLLREIVEETRGELEKNLVGQLETYLSVVEEQIRRCKSVTENLLSFTRIPHRSCDTTQVNQLLKQAVELVVRLSDKNPNIEMILDERLPRLLCDPNQLEQVFINLLSNALKAIDSGGKITLATRLEPDSSVSIEFKDSGCGIPLEIQGRIFDPFFTTRPEGEGTGLGLSISHYIIQQMNGKIAVHSAPGEGATFTVTLPVSNRTADTVSAAF